jgi:hypothetical protein
MNDFVLLFLSQVKKSKFDKSKTSKIRTMAKKNSDLECSDTASTDNDGNVEEILSNADTDEGDESTDSVSESSMEQDDELSSFEKQDDFDDTTGSLEQDPYSKCTQLNPVDMQKESRRFAESPPSTKIPDGIFGGFSPLQSIKYDRHLIIPLKALLPVDTYYYANNVWEEKATRTDSKKKPVPIRNNYRRVHDSDTITEDDNKRGAHDINYNIKSETLEQDSNTCECLTNQEEIALRDQRFANLNHWVVQMVKDNKLTPRNTFPCSSKGKANSIHLIVADVSCLAQHFHFDFDPETFRNDPNIYNGSSLFIHFRNSWASLDVGWCHHNPTQRKQLLIPPMSVLLIRGDFKHAGSANTGPTKIMKYFMYLDPHDREGYRAKNNDTLFYDNDEERDWILTKVEIDELKQTVINYSAAKRKST